MRALRLDTLRLGDASFVDEQLAGHFADIVLHCDASEDGASATISELLEHKSYVSDLNTGHFSCLTLGLAQSPAKVAKIAKAGFAVFSGGYSHCAIARAVRQNQVRPE